MPIVFSPSPNKLNRGFSSSHPGYDHDDVPDNNAVCSLIDAVVIQVVDKYDTSWVQGQPQDPTPDGLTTEDYGNFRKLKGFSIDGVQLYQITAHLQKGTDLKVGQKLQPGDVIGLAGNNTTDTGNSTGGHTHNEYRDMNNQAVEVSFSSATVPAKDPMSEKTKTDAEWQVERDERNKNWDLYNSEVEARAKDKKDFEKRISSLDTQLQETRSKLETALKNQATATPQKDIDEVKRLMQEAHEQEILAIKAQQDERIDDATKISQKNLLEAKAQISALEAELLVVRQSWKYRLTSRKFLLTAPTALFNMGIAFAVLFGFKPDPMALATALTSLNGAVALFVVPEAITDHKERMLEAK